MPLPETAEPLRFSAAADGHSEIIDRKEKDVDPSLVLSGDFRDPVFIDVDVYRIIFLHADHAGF